MKKYILPLVAISCLVGVPLVFGAIVPGDTSGDTLGTTDLPYGTIPEDADFNIWTLLENALNWFFNIVIAIAAIMIVYSGFQYVTASGDTTKTGKALNTLIYALIGIAIALIAKGVIYLVASFFGETLP
jgi:hypothetical protein